MLKRRTKGSLGGTDRSSLRRFCSNSPALASTTPAWEPMIMESRVYNSWSKKNCLSTGKAHPELGQSTRKKPSERYEREFWRQSEFRSPGPVLRSLRIDLDGPWRKMAFCNEIPLATAGNSFSRLLESRQKFPVMGCSLC